MNNKVPLQYECIVTQPVNPGRRAICRVKPSETDYVCDVVLEIVPDCACNVVLKGKAERISLHLGTKRFPDEAMQLCLRYAQSYFNDLPMTAEEFLLWKRSRWPSLFKTRLDALDLIFFGSGDQWFDGRLTDTRPELCYDYPDRIYERRLMAWQWLNLDKELPEDIPEEDLPEVTLPASLPPDYPPDDGKDCVFAAASYPENNLTGVPDNVTDDWLELALEAAKALRDRTLSREGDCAEMKKLVQKSREMGRVMASKLERMKEQRQTERETEKKNSFEAKCARASRAKTELEEYRSCLDAEVREVVKAEAEGGRERK